ncbi:MAG: hypothetical protein VKL39_11050 [Leptolyngbyaceae bacterium]|nr:hypothetical protein [Leptolyngbyaceae bacterium]
MSQTSVVLSGKGVSSIRSDRVCRVSDYIRVQIVKRVIVCRQGFH